MSFTLSPLINNLPQVSELNSVDYKALLATIKKSVEGIEFKSHLTSDDGAFVVYLKEWLQTNKFKKEVDNSSINKKINVLVKRYYRYQGIVQTIQEFLDDPEKVFSSAEKTERVFSYLVKNESYKTKGGEPLKIIDFNNYKFNYDKIKTHIPPNIDASNLSAIGYIYHSKAHRQLIGKVTAGDNNSNLFSSNYQYNLYTDDTPSPFSLPSFNAPDCTKGQLAILYGTLARIDKIEIDHEIERDRKSSQQFFNYVLNNFVLPPAQAIFKELWLQDFKKPTTQEEKIYIIHEIIKKYNENISEVNLLLSLICIEKSLNIIDAAHEEKKLLVPQIALAIKDYTNDDRNIILSYVSNVGNYLSLIDTNNIIWQFYLDNLCEKLSHKSVVTEKNKLLEALSSVPNVLISKNIEYKSNKI